MTTDNTDRLFDFSDTSEGKEMSRTTEKTSCPKQEGEHTDLVNAIKAHVSGETKVYPLVPLKYIVVSADWLRLAVSDYSRAQGAISRCTSSACMLVTLIVTLVATDFKEAHGISAEFWGALFLVAVLFCFLLFVYNLIDVVRNWKHRSVNDLMEKIRGDAGR